ncbi:MAG: hypothetical protein RL012_551 [Bacteroidota bacterium]|jgi:hypothetical protein
MHGGVKTPYKPDILGGWHGAFGAVLQQTWNLQQAIQKNVKTYKTLHYSKKVASY